MDYKSTLTGKYYDIKMNGGLLDDVKTEQSGRTTITGYFASFGNVDADRDMVQRGAAKKSIQESGSRVRHLLQHNAYKPMAKPMIEEDENGVRFESVIDQNQMKVQYISDTVNLYKSGVYDEHSFGFITDKSYYDEDMQANIITELKFIEGSTVTWGANSQTPFTGFKSMTTTEQLSTLDKRIDKICKALRTGGLSDEMYIQLEIELQQIKSLIHKQKPFDKGTSDTIEPIVKSIQSFRKSLLDESRKRNSEGT